MLRWFSESLDDGSYKADEDVVLVRNLARGRFASFFTRNRAAVVSAVERRPWVDCWLRLYLSGEAALSDSRDSRGIKYADKVTEQGWNGFGESLEVARKALSASWETDKDRPEAA